MRQPCRDGVDERPVGGQRVRTPHGGEQAIARVLQRQMKVWRHPSAAAGDEIDDLRRAVHRLERADPECDVEIGGEERPQQLDQRRVRVQIAAVRTEMDAGEGDLLETGFSDSPRLGDDGRK